MTAVMRAGTVPAAALFAAVTAIALGVPGCMINEQHGGGPMAADTLRGIVEVAGAEPLTRVVLRTPDGDVPLEGEATAALRRASGAEVWIAGQRGEDGAMAVAEYRVRAVDREVAADGMLEVDGADVILVTADGERLRYQRAPTALRALAGHRVWIAGQPGREPTSWGVLEPGS
jgi:hypothetical protein